jgi:DNA-directed RNA polymerase subunit L
MIKETIVIPNQGHTLACMLRTLLFEHGAQFASCTVPHPQDQDLVIVIHHEDDCKECLLSSLRELRDTLERCKNTVLSVQIHQNL